MSGGGCVFFHDGDYAGFPRRVAALVLDVFASLLLLRVPLEVMARFHPEMTRDEAVRAAGPYVWLALAAVIAYHVAGRRLRDGTIGYRIMRQRLVGLNGAPPEWRALAGRFLLAVPMALLFLAGYWRILRDRRRQAVHDRWAGTWVVKSGASPAGGAQPVLRSTLVGSMVLTWWDVEPVETVAAATGETGLPRARE